MNIYISIPRFSNSGGNLVSLDLANYLSSNGFDVICFSGFSFKKPENVVLSVKNKGVLNSIANILSFLSCSFVSIFLDNHVATHHLTSLLNFIKPSRLSLVQDVEADFYPCNIKVLGRFFWRNYLKSKNLIFTNQMLSFKIMNSIPNNLKGFPSVDLELTKYIYIKTRSSHVGMPEYDAVLVLRDGEYKNPKGTVDCFKLLVSQGLKVVLVNLSRLTVDCKCKNGLILDGLTRDEFLNLLTRTNFYICLSSWEGLGLPNIEAFILGTKVISTKIPSAVLLNTAGSEYLYLIDGEPIEVLEILKKNTAPDSSNLNFHDRMFFLREQNEAWNKYALDIIKAVCDE